MISFILWQKFFIPTIQTSIYLNVLTYVVHPSTASFIAFAIIANGGKQLRIPLHSISYGENPYFVQQNTERQVQNAGYRSMSQVTENSIKC